MSRQGYTKLEGFHAAEDLRLGCVVSRFNSVITDRLLEGALKAIRYHGGRADQVVIARVPGSLELATAARALVQSGNFDALICLGAVIRGDTAHYEHVASGAASQIARIGPETGVPTTFGVLTCDRQQQALDRSGDDGNNAGYQAAESAIEMARLLSEIRSM